MFSKTEIQPFSLTNHSIFFLPCRFVHFFIEIILCHTSSCIGKHVIIPDSSRLLMQ